MGLFDFVSLPVSLSHLRAGVSIFEKKGENDFGRSIALIDLDKKVITKRRCYQCEQKIKLASKVLAIKSETNLWTKLFYGFN